MTRFPATVVAIGVLFAACSSDAALPGVAGSAEASPAEAMISGGITYDENVSLPRDAAVDVWIVDVTPGVVAAAIVAEMTIEAGNARSPIPYKLRYDPSRVFADHDYAVKAVIRSGGETLFEMPNDFLVLTKGRPDRVDVWVKKVGIAGPGPAPPAANPPAAASSPASSSPAPSLAGTLWRLDDLGGEAVPTDADGTLDFAEAGRIAGRAFCNRFTGKVEITGPSIRVGPLASTKMACGQSAMEREARFLAALQDAERYAIDGSTLRIYFRGSEAPLRLSKR